MSSFVVFAVLAVSGGRRVTANRPPPNENKVTSHIIYASSVSLLDNSVRNAEIRHWAPSSSAILPDNTVVLLLAKAYAPPDGVFLFDTLLLVPFPGDPDAPDYDDHLPDFHTPWVCATGRAHSATTTLADGVSRGFELLVTEYVRDESKMSYLQ